MSSMIGAASGGSPEITRNSEEGAESHSFCQGSRGMVY